MRSSTSSITRATFIVSSTTDVPLGMDFRHVYVHLGRAPVQKFKNFDPRNFCRRARHGCPHPSRRPLYFSLSVDSNFVFNFFILSLTPPSSWCSPPPYCTSNTPNTTLARIFSYLSPFPRCTPPFHTYFSALPYIFRITSPHTTSE